MLDDGTGGAVGGALAAPNAGRIGQADVACGGDARVEAPLQEAQRPDVLDLLADLDAAAAGDALARIEDHGLDPEKIIINKCPAHADK